jgi:hypothetical protein
VYVLLEILLSNFTWWIPVTIASCVEEMQLPKMRFALSLVLKPGFQVLVDIKFKALKATELNKLFLSNKPCQLWIKALHFNEDSRFMLSQAWHSLNNILKNVKQHLDEWVQRYTRLSDTISDIDQRGFHHGRRQAFQGDGRLTNFSGAN